MAWLLRADIDRDTAQLVESTKIVPIYKEGRKSQVEGNKGIERCAGQNHTHGCEWVGIQEKKDVGRDLGMYSWKSFVEKAFANR